MRVICKEVSLQKEGLGKDGGPSHFYENFGIDFISF